VAVDRQPRVPTLLWKPDRHEWDSFDLKLPDDIASGKYRVELLMYQGNDDTSVLLLDQNFQPQEKFVLGEFIVK
jgi:hypothetical protein